MIRAPGWRRRSAEDTGPHVRRVLCAEVVVDPSPMSSERLEAAVEPVDGESPAAAASGSAPNARADA